MENPEFISIIFVRDTVLTVPQNCTLLNSCCFYIVKEIRDCNEPLCTVLLLDCLHFFPDLKSSFRKQKCGFQTVPWCYPQGPLLGKVAGGRIGRRGSAKADLTCPFQIRTYLKTKFKKLL